jgi:hypothetical protein
VNLDQNQGKKIWRGENHEKKLAGGTTVTFYLFLPNAKKKYCVTNAPPPVRVI